VSAILAIAESRVDLLDAFTERASARAYLWAIGEYEMAEAVDQLQADTERDGLVKRIGQDGVQAILASAFRPYREAETVRNLTEQDQGAAEINTSNVTNLTRTNESLGALWVRLNDPRRHSTPQSVIEAIMYSVRERGLGALKEPDNVERLSRCDQAAMTQIEKRIDTLRQKGTLK
jgi:hypothetical protein